MWEREKTGYDHACELVWMCHLPLFSSDHKAPSSGLTIRTVRLIIIRKLPRYVSVPRPKLGPTELGTWYGLINGLEGDLDGSV